ncbi:MAG: OmpA family protein [Candidatus Omnitrophota bacterium]|nr:OmpA family protein [Candidatus Omnitrophota bacterium]
MKGGFLHSTFIIFCILALTGCTFVFQGGRRSDVEKIEELSEQIDELTEAKRLLEEKFSKEIDDKQIKLQMQEKGLVITVVGDLLFDSGKAKIRRDGYSVLNKVGDFLKDNVPELNVGIEGHTDNQPIKHSGWKSNWELSTARALAVLHYMANEEGISPNRLSAIGYGEYRPVASNDTTEGRLANRRVEIVIMPKLTKLTNTGVAAPTQTADSASMDEPQESQEPQENLK